MALPSTSHATGLKPGQLGLVKVIIRGLAEKPPNQVLRKAKVQDPLFNSFFLRTKAKERARIQFADGTQLNLNQRTDAVLQDTHHLIIHSGEVDQVDAKGSVHRISTNIVAVAGLGTNYDVKVVNGKVYVTVVQGRVAVNNPGGRVIVRPNQQTVIAGRRKPRRPYGVNAKALIAWVRGLDTNGWISITPSNPTSRSFDSIQGLTVGDHGHLFAATDLGIIEFTTSGKKLRTFGARGLYGGIAIDKSNYVYVAASRGIAKYTVAGHRVALLGAASNGAANGTDLAGGRGLAVDSQGNIYVSGLGDTGLLKVSPSGTVLGSFGDPGLQYHSGIAVDRYDNVYVVANDGAIHGNIVEKFSPSGQRLARWGTIGKGYTWPVFDSIAISRKGRVFLTAPEEYDPNIHGVTGTSFVYELTHKGVLRTIWGRARAIWPSPGAFISPTGIAVDKKGNVYVGDNYRLQKIPWFDT